jgi:hypothetical protein
MFWPDDYVPLNGCRSCGADFTSLTAFDAHRVGKHMPLTRRCVDPETVGLVRVQPGDSTTYDTRVATGVPLYWDAASVASARDRFQKETPAHAIA